jgi:protein dithiol oxidoreductase (disulfide-forming)
MKAAVSALIVVTALLAGCGSSDPAPAPVPSSTPDASAPAATAAPAPAPAATTTPTPEVVAAPTTGEAAPATEAATTAPAAAAATTPAATPAPTAAAAPVAAPTGPEPREGIDYTVIEPAQPLSASPGKIEVAEAFAYHCIHCSSIQVKVTPWKAKLPADVEFRYVPMAHGVSEPFARAFYAAEAMGELDRTHDAMFKAIAVERRIKQGTAEELADLYAELGVDRDALLSTMKSFAVNAQIARNQKTTARWAIEGTPTFIVNGRYKAEVTRDRGHDGALSTVEHLVARERARMAGTAGTP